jgi:hypothetical protein
MVGGGRGGLGGGDERAKAEIRERCNASREHTGRGTIVCVCVRARVRACVWLCVRACVRVVSVWVSVVLVCVCVWCVVFVRAWCVCSV